MLFEIRRTCLYKLCQKCGGKLFRYIRKGTYESDEYGLTHGIQVWDRCESCYEVFGSTQAAIHTAELEEKVVSLFDRWDQRDLTDAEFALNLQVAFHDVGGWANNPDQQTG